jgi:hypothetical protein
MINKQLRYQVWQKTNGVCFYCGIEMEFEFSGLDCFTVDHFKPLIVGGEDAIENLVPACRSCNAGKQSRTLEQFRHCMVNRRRGQVFSQPQIEYLRDHGLELPIIKHRFWFEEKGFEVPLNEPPPSPHEYHGKRSELKPLLSILSLAR